MAETAGPWTLTARWVFPADRSPLPRGTITIQGDKIVAVEPAGTRAADEDLGNVAILPGLVNGHTHLDLSDARGKIPPTPDFTAWLRGVIQHRRGQTAEQVRQAIADGISESSSYGVTLFGDIAARGASWRELNRASVRATMYWELIGLSLSAAKNAWREMIIEKKRFADTERCLFGLSPHAPYTAHHSLLRAAVSNGNLTAIHLAETAAEMELIEHRSGPFVTFLQQLNVWDSSGLVSFNRIFRRTRDCNLVLYIHCNYLQSDAAIRPNGTIVYCPRTHAAFGHPPHPFREFLKRGVRVVLGTDSLASNPDLDILAEARFVAARHPDLPGETLLRMITLDGAIALGWDNIAGSLTPGKSADLVVLPLPDREDADPYRLLFDSALAVRRVLFRGEWTV